MSQLHEDVNLLGFVMWDNPIGCFISNIITLLPVLIWQYSAMKANSSYRNKHLLFYSCSETMHGFGFDIKQPDDVEEHAMMRKLWMGC